MSIYDDVLADQKDKVKLVVELAYNWIHNNPTATAGQVQTAITNWEDAQGWELISTITILYLIDRFGGGSWPDFRDRVLTLEPSLVDKFLEDAESAEDISQIRSKAETIKDALIATGSPITIIRDTSGIEWKRNFVISETVTGTVNGTPYTVRQLSDPQYDGQRTSSNPLGWELI